MLYFIIYFDDSTENENIILYTWMKKNQYPITSITHWALKAQYVFLFSLEKIEEERNS